MICTLSLTVWLKCRFAAVVKWQRTHWGRVTHIYVSKISSIVSDNGLSPDRRQAIIWNNAEILLFRTPGINFSRILIQINTFSFKEMHLKMSTKWRLFRLGFDELMNFSGNDLTYRQGTMKMMFNDSFWVDITTLKQHCISANYCAFWPQVMSLHI